MKKTSLFMTGLVAGVVALMTIQWGTAQWKDRGRGDIWVDFSTSPYGAEVTVDNKRCFADFALLNPKMTYTIRVEAPGFEPKVIDGFRPKDEGGQRQHLYLSLTPAPPDPCQPSKPKGCKCGDCECMDGHRGGDCICGWSCPCKDVNKHPPFKKETPKAGVDEQTDRPNPSHPFIPKGAPDDP